MKAINYLAIAMLGFSTQIRAEEKWVSLFDGESLAGWVTGKGEAAKEGAWVAEDGVLFRKSAGGDLFSEEDYGDFEFSWEWKISPKGNSGVKYRVQKYSGANFGPEYQILDNEHRDGKKTTKRQAGALYDLKAIGENASAKPVGEWNQSRLVVKGKHFQHYLNGVLAVEVTVGDDEWEKIFSESKYKAIAGFARNPVGKLMLQDHGDQAWFRDLKIREIMK